MLEGLRAEFPEIARWRVTLRRPAVARESTAWAFLSSLGAGLLLGGVVRLLLLVLDPILFPATEPHPEWLRPFAITEVAAALASGAVLVRAGGPAAVVLFVVYELATVVAAFPYQQMACSQLVLPLGGGIDVACDLPTVVLRRWPEWGSLALGALAARVLVAGSARGANWTLRGAGTYVLVSTVLGAIVTALRYADQSLDGQLTSIELFVVVQLAAGAAAGIVLARSRLAAAVLLAVVIMGPSLAFAIPQALAAWRSSWAVASSPDYVLLVWWSALAPLVSAASIVTARGLARRRGGGTFF